MQRLDAPHAPRLLPARARVFIGSIACELRTFETVPPMIDRNAWLLLPMLLPASAALGCEAFAEEAHDRCGDLALATEADRMAEDSATISGTVTATSLNPLGMTTCLGEYDDARLERVTAVLGESE